MGTQPISAFQTVLDKTKNNPYKSQMMLMNMEKKLGLKNPDTVSSENKLRMIEKMSVAQYFVC